MAALTRSLSRPAFLQGGAAAFGAAALRVPAGAADLTSVTLGTAPDIDNIGALWAVKSGAFARAGLDVKLQSLNSGGAVVPAVIGGSLDIGKSNAFSLISAHLKGVPLRLQAIADIYDANHPNAAFVVAKNSSIRGPRDLAGKTLASPAIADSASTITSAWINANGGDAKLCKYIELPMPLIPNAIASGTIDGAQLQEQFLQQALDSGKFRVIGYPFSTIGKYFGITYYFTTKAYAEANPDLLKRFRKSLAEATTYAIAHRNEMLPIIADFTKMGRSVVDKMDLDVGVGMDPGTMQTVIDFTARAQVHPAAFPATDMIDPAALAKG